MEKKVMSMESLVEEWRESSAVALEELHQERQERKRLQERSKMLEKALELKTAEHEDALRRYTDDIEKRHLSLTIPESRRDTSLTQDESRGRN